MYRTEPFSFFVPTRIEYGIGKVNQLVKELKGLNAKRPLIVTDKGLVKAGALKGIEEQLKANSIEYTVFSDVESNPRDGNVEKAVAMAREHRADALIGVGGGSSMDTAKCAGVLITNGGKIGDYYGYYKVKKQILPLITIPTTAGTGSEVSIWAVITNTQKEPHVKECLGSQLMCPTVALVDPLMTVALPPHLTAYTGIDALSHAVEGYFCLVAEPIADVLALSAIQLISDNLVPATMNGNNLEARDNMLLGSLMAGIVLGVTDCGAIHCLGHAIGGLYDVHHGLSMAIFFPYVLEYNMGTNPERFANIARAMGENVDGLPALEAARKSIDGIVKLLRILRIPTLKDVGVKEQDFEEIARLALADPTSEANPRKMTVKDMKEICKDAYADKFDTAC